jgi:hypothetical protein
MNWRCRIFGHDIEPVGAFYYSVDRCFRCSPYGDGCALEVYDAGWRERIKVRCRIALRWLNERWWMLQAWHRCSECGRRFGRHDSNYDHLPF